MSVEMGAPDASETVREADSDPLRDRYRPHLDGLRAVAVYLVVVFHAGSEPFSGGFIGVDVFFVLSGFLVTRLLVRDLTSRGSVSFERFYARRFRRLLPAAFVMLVVTATVVSALASPLEVDQAEEAFQAAFLYVANWYFVDQATDYFGADVATSPVLHFWSLAVEEQFYLLWPLLLGGLYAVARRFGGRRWHVLRLLVAAGALASVAWAWSLRSSDPIRGYYGTDARAYQLLAGALLALTPGLLARLSTFDRTARWAGVAGLGALVLVSSSWVEVDAIERGMAATVVAVAIIASLEAARGGVARGVLSASPMVYLGKVSYGTYLWHWPVIWVMARTLELSVLSTVALTALTATGLASLSYQLLEQPIRLSGLLDRHRAGVIAGGLAISALAALLVIPAIVDRADGEAVAIGTPELATTGLTPVPDLDLDAIRADLPPEHTCLDEPVSACTLVEGEGAHILLMGDSHARMLTPTFAAVARREGLRLSVSSADACPWQQDLHVVVKGFANQRQECEAVQQDLYDRVVDELDPDVIVLVNRGYEAARTTETGLHYLGSDGSYLERSSPEFDAWLSERTRRSLDQLADDARALVLVEPIPYPADNVDALACLSREDVTEACRYVVDARPSSVEQLYRRIDQEDEAIWSADLDRLACPFFPICDPIVDGQVVKLDASHLTGTYAESLAPAVGDYLRANGIID
jgi:peptidoglycan/LPS O-acetylase OafA/YrhL